MTSNPMINNSRAEDIVFEGKQMTAGGAVNKTIILTGIVVACAMLS